MGEMPANKLGFLRLLLHVNFNSGDEFLACAAVTDLYDVKSDVATLSSRRRCHLDGLFLYIDTVASQIAPRQLQDLFTRCIGVFCRSYLTLHLARSCARRGDRCSDVQSSSWLRECRALDSTLRDPPCCTAREVYLRSDIQPLRAHTPQAVLGKMEEADYRSVHILRLSSMLFCLI